LENGKLHIVTLGGGQGENGEGAAIAYFKIFQSKWPAIVTSVFKLEVNSM
jgi:hypothetical protein